MSERTSWIKVYDFKRDGENPQAVNSVRTVDLGTKMISMAFTGEAYYALDNMCPHAGARFGAGGWCDHGDLVCPVHRYRYNLANGRGKQGDYVNTYPVEKREDGVYVGITKKSWWPF